MTMSGDVQETEKICALITGSRGASDPLSSGEKKEKRKEKLAQDELIWGNTKSRV